jgi:2-hydroxychromene-2-carboxylate isomerase
MTHEHVDFWFDFVSGYSWIAMAEAEAFARDHAVTWRPRPFVLGVVLERCGREAIAQVGATRGYAVFDVARHAHRLGLQLRGPPEHPFLSLKALRAAALFQDTALGIPVAKALFDAAWEQNRDLTDTDVVVAAVASAGADAERLAERIAKKETKDLLRANTDAALAAGVFGAPFFHLEGEPFWGQDRLHLLAERLDGRAGLDPATRDRLLSGDAETTSG